jgi:hypothetical protein
VLDISHGNVDITHKVVNISPASDAGTGELPSLIMRLNAKNGQFITRSTGLDGSSTPIVDQFTVFKVIFTDLNGVSFIKGYLVDTFKQIENIQEGDRLEVQCFGLEYWIQRLDFAKQYYFADANSTWADIADKYNLNRGSNPQIINHHNIIFNQLPVWTANSYLFNVSETACYTGMLEVIDKLGTSVQNQGASDFFEMKFMNGDVSAGGYPGSGIDFTKLTPLLFSSGAPPLVQVDERPPANPQILTPSTFLKVTEIDGEVEAQQGTLLKGWGDDQSGSLPTDFSKFRGIDEAYFLFPDWQNPTITNQLYPQNALAFYDTGSGRQLYTSNINNNSSVPPTNWTLITESQLLTINGVTQYSPWTNGPSAVSAWQSCFANPDGSGAAPFNSAAAFDANIIVQDGTYYRTMADIRAVNGVQIPDAMKIRDHNDVPQFYRGFRVLLDTSLGNLGSPFVGNPNGNFDRFGNPMENAIIQNNGSGTNTWKDWDCVWTTSATPKGPAFQLKTNYVVPIWREARNYLWNGGNYVDNSGALKGNDCFHTRDNFMNAKGTSSVPKLVGTYGDTSAIQLTYKWTPLNSVLGFVFTNANYYQAGWWLCKRFPFPSSILVGATPVGSFYGGYHNPNQNNYALEPATFDSLNMHLTHSGNSGFNQIDSEDLAPAYGIGLQMKMAFTNDAGTPIIGPTGTVANFKMRYYCFDTNDNVVYSEFVIAFNNVFQDIVLPFSSFQIYRGRIPLSFGDLTELVPPPQLNILNVFFWRNIKQIVIQCQNMYDEQGRYAPELSDLNTFALLFLPIGDHANLTGTMDSWRFVKPLLCTSNVGSNTVTGNVIEPEPLQRKNITNYFQLKQDVLSMLQIYQFRRREYEITMNLNCFVRFGDTFYLRNPNVVETQSPPDVAPDGISTNTIKLVCKNASQYLNKTDGGPGGLITILRGVKRYPQSGV